MSERNLLNRVRKLKELEAQKKAIEDQMEALKAEIQADMEAKGLEDHRIPSDILLLPGLLKRE